MVPKASLLLVIAISLLLHVGCSIDLDDIVLNDIFETDAYACNLLSTCGECNAQSECHYCIDTKTCELSSHSCVLSPYCNVTYQCADFKDCTECNAGKDAEDKQCGWVKKIGYCAPKDDGDNCTDATIVSGVAGNLTTYATGEQYSILIIGNVDPLLFLELHAYFKAAGVIPLKTDEVRSSLVLLGDLAFDMKGTKYSLDTYLAEGFAPLDRKTSFKSVTTMLSLLEFVDSSSDRYNFTTSTVVKQNMITTATNDAPIESGLVTDTTFNFGTYGKIIRTSSANRTNTYSRMTTPVEYLWTDSMFEVHIMLSTYTWNTSSSDLAVCFNIPSFTTDASNFANKVFNTSSGAYQVTFYDESRVYATGNYVSNIAGVAHDPQTTNPTDGFQYDNTVCVTLNTSETDNAVEVVFWMKLSIDDEKAMSIVDNLDSGDDDDDDRLRVALTGIAVVGIIVFVVSISVVVLGVIVAVYTNRQIIANSVLPYVYKNVGYLNSENAEKIVGKLLEKGEVSLAITELEVKN